MKLNKILASSCRQKILLALSRMKKANMMKLVRSINSTYNKVDRNLRILEEEGIITSRHVGRNRILTLNYENTKTATLLKALKVLDGLNSSKKFSRKNSEMKIHET